MTVKLSIPLVEYTGYTSTQPKVKGFTGFMGANTAKKKLVSLLVLLLGRTLAGRG